jgi:hypothetical protein
LHQPNQTTQEEAIEEISIILSRLTTPADTQLLESTVL